MSQPTTVPQASVTEEAFLADRMKFWSSFTSFSTVVIVGIVVLLVLMAIFLV